MKFIPPLATGFLIKRYKRFLADVRLENGVELTMHCPNTGAMTFCADAGSRIWYSTSANKTRKYPNTFELVEVASGALACINTGRANALVKEGIENGVVSELSAYTKLRAEVRYGEENSRVDFVLEGHPDRPEQACYVEVKSVTLGLAGGLGIFPDAVTSRGLKHLRELIQMKAEGARAILLFCVQHTSIERVEPADMIDPRYGAGLRQAAAAGVELLAYRADLSPQEIKLVRAVPVILPHLLK